MHKVILSVIAALCLIVSPKVFAADDAVVAGKLIKADYTLTVNNEVLETSVGKTPLEFIVGGQSIIPGLEKGILGMHVGEEKIIVVEPADAYGQPDAKAVKEFPKASMPKGLELKKGMVLQANAPDGNTFPAVIKEIKDTTILLDFNHPLAGKQLQFKIKVLSIAPAPTAPTSGITAVGTKK